MRSFKPNIDKNGLVVQSVSKDGGDTPINTGMTMLGVYLSFKEKLPFDTNDIKKLSSPKRCLKHLMCGNRFRRHPNPDSGMSRCDLGTRDQATGIVVLMLIGVLLKEVPRMQVLKFLWELFKFKKEIFGSTHKLTWLVCFMRTFNFTNWREPVGGPNTGKSTADFADPMLFSMGLRAVGGWWLWPIYSILDLWLILSTIFVRFQKDDKVQPHIVRCMVARHIYPTLPSLIAFKMNNWDDLYSKLESFCERANESGDQGPPMHQIYWPLMQLKN